MSRAQHIQNHYRPRIDQQRANYDVVDWASAEAQQIRFAVLADNVELDDHTLLDVGCGLGDLYAYLTDRGISAEYCGVDLLSEMIEAASTRNPGARFVCGDIFDPQSVVLAPDEHFDVVFCSGALNLKLATTLNSCPKHWIACWNYQQNIWL